MPEQKPVAIVGIGAIMPDAQDASAFWENIKSAKYSITEVSPERWRTDLYFDPDPLVPDKTYSKIGGWVRNFQFEPFKWGIAIPPRVIAQMDEAQQWSIAASRQALVDYGYPKRVLDPARVAIILGNALGGEKHYVTTLRIRAPEIMDALTRVPEFQGLPVQVQQALLAGMQANVRSGIVEINEDTMPGELSNIIAGRVANVFNFSGPNFVTDAACASSLAALQAAVEGLNNYQFDAVLTGGVDRGMGVEAFVKFSKIGALSPDGTRPYADGANGFVMGEGAAVFLLKRLEDAEKDGDRVYAVIRGIGGSSDGKGKGITAPNPAGQVAAIERAWKNAGVSPQTAGLIEGHGTSTRVGDVVEVNSLNAIFGQFGLPAGKIALGSVKSNIGHLKSAAGAAGLFKAAMALADHILPPSVNFERPNPNIDFSTIPFSVNTRLRPWEVQKGEVRRAGVSSFGFGGTNFHVVLEEYLPGMLTATQKVYPGVELAGAAAAAPLEPQSIKPYRGLLFLSEDTPAGLKEALERALNDARQGKLPESVMPSSAQLSRAERIAIDFGSAEELIKRAEKALKGFDGEVGGQNPWPALVAQAVYRGSGAPGKVAFLFPGQGSQYVNMLKDLCEVEPVVADTFAEADRVMSPILGRPLTSFIYVDGDETALAEAEKALRNTAITQPAMLTANVALLRLMRKYGYEPDMVIGHSLGEYAALVAAGVLTFAEALEVVSARGREMTKVSMGDNGCMAAVSAPLTEVERILKTVDGYVVIANINSPLQSVIGGDTSAVEAAVTAFLAAGFQATKIPVSHAFHTRIVEPASRPLRDVIARMSVNSPDRLIAANVTGEPYPSEREKILDILASQVASPVQFIKGIETLYANGARVFVEIGPKRVLNALATDILKDRGGIAILATNHPRKGAVVSYNEALCGLLAAGVGGKASPAAAAIAAQVKVKPAGTMVISVPEQSASSVDRDSVKTFVLQLVSEKTGYPAEMLDLDLDLEADLGVDTVKQAELFAAVRTNYGIPRREDLRLSDYNTLEKVIGFVTSALESNPVPGTQIVAAAPSPAPALPAVETVKPAPETVRTVQPALQEISDGRLPLTGSVVISGAGLGLPGKGRNVFDDNNVQQLLSGAMRIDSLPETTRQRMMERRVTRLIKSEAGAVWEVIDQLDQTVKLGGQRGNFDLTGDFGVPDDRVDSYDIATQLAVAAGVEALRDAGIPLVMNYRMTSKGTYLPDRWKLPEGMADETGVIFGSAFPGLDRMSEETGKYYEFTALKRQRDELAGVLTLIPENQTDLRRTLETRMAELEARMAEIDYKFDRKFIFRILSMGHSQFAEYIGARGPNTHVNAACATTTHAVSVAEDWIRSGRARRVVIIAGDDVTSGSLVDWVGTGLMASGAATTEGRLRMAALPFDRRRNGLIMGMGAAAMVVESEDSVRERGMRGICEVLSTQIANSAFHGTRLDVSHVSDVMDRTVSLAEQRFGIRRDEIAPHTVFVSHETYTPARGGSASAEIRALRSTFGPQANRVVIANTKGFTGHTMGVGVEDVLAVKALEFQTVPPIAHIDEGFEPDPDLGDLNLSKGGSYDVEYALRLGAGFGSQIAMTLTRRIPGRGERIEDKPRYSRWLSEVAGYEHAELEVEKRTLRIRDQGWPVKPPARSNWTFGQGPTLWAERNMTAPVQVSLPVQVQVSTPVERPAVAAAAAVPSAPMVTPAGQSAERSAVQQFVLGLVSEKTGYPTEMLDLDLDLEADLGVDTVKQAELFAAVRTNYGIPRREDLRLADYNTLDKVIGFVMDALGSSQPVKVSQPVPAVVPAAVQEAPSAKPAPSAGEAERIAVQAFVLGLVSEKTGYPTEMLDLDLDLEADLGIDTVKQAELFAAVRMNYGIPRREDLRLSDYNTLDKVIGFVMDALAAQTPVQESEQSNVPLPAPEEVSPVDEPVHETTLKRRVPVAVLRARLDLCEPTGITLGEGSRVMVVTDRGKTADSLARRLRSRKVQVMLVDPEPLEDLAARVSAAAGENPVQGVYFLPGLDMEAALRGMDAPTWSAEIARRGETLAVVMKSLAGEPFLVAGTRLGGLNGAAAGTHPAAMGGLVSGFVKALAWERPGVLYKTVDFDGNCSDSTVAARLLAETLADPMSEVGWEGDLRFGLDIEEQEVAASNFDLPEGSVFVVSGGSGGITGPVLVDLARATRGTFYLLSRTRLPEPGNPDLALLKNDRSGLKQRLMKQLAEAGEKATPAVVDLKIAALERGAATLESMALIERAGGKAVYLPCDISDPAQVAEAVARIAAEQQQVDVFLHAAGMERSRKLETKPVEEIRQTIAVKAHGFFHLFKGLEAQNRIPRAVVFFSSVAGRFGNTGQCDYSAANDLLCKLAGTLPQEYPGLKAIAIDWGAWSEVGMASRGFIPELMKRVGIEMIAPVEAAPAVRRELLSGRSGEVVLAGSLGALEERLSANGGVDLEKANHALREGAPIHIMLSTAAGYSMREGVLLEAELDPQAEPFLKDHALNGIPVLPGVMGIEGFTVAARHVASRLASEKSGFIVSELEDICFDAAFKFYKGKPRRITWKARVVREPQGLVAYVTLESTVMLFNRSEEKMRHFSGKVHLQPVEDGLREAKAQPPHWNGAFTLSAEDIYRLYFHGPAFQVLEGVQRSGEQVLGKLRANQPQITSGGTSLVSAPVLVELCLQTAGIWEAGKTGVLALPASIGRLDLYQAETTPASIYAQVMPRTNEEGRMEFDARVVDETGQVYLEVKDYRTSPLPYSVEETLLKPIKQLIEE